MSEETKKAAALSLRTESERHEVVVPGHFQAIDNATVENVVEVKRTMVPVRITTVTVQVKGNGFIVDMPEGGKIDRWGNTEGVELVYGSLGEAIQCIADHIGKITYAYREEGMNGERDELESLQVRHQRMRLKKEIREMEAEDAELLRDEEVDADDE